MVMVWALSLSAQADEAQFTLSPEISIEEQAALERLNAVRADPSALQRCGGALEGTAVQPLAPHQTLMSVARDRAAELVGRDELGHLDPQGYGPNQRLVLRGYPLALQLPIRIGGRSFLYASDEGANEVEALYRDDRDKSASSFTPDDWIGAMSALIADDCDSSGARRGLLLSRAGVAIEHREVGIGAAFAALPSGTRRMVMVVESALRRGEPESGWITGVVYIDQDHDGQYDEGEGMPELRVEVEGRAWTLTTAGGGYVLPAPPWRGVVTVLSQRRDVSFSGSNQKIDFVVEPREIPKATPPPPPEGAPSYGLIAAIGGVLAAAAAGVGVWFGLRGAAFSAAVVLRIAPDEFEIREVKPLFLSQVGGTLPGFRRDSRVYLHPTGQVNGVAEGAIAEFTALVGGEVQVCPLVLVESLDEKTGNWLPAAKGVAVKGRILAAKDVLFMIDEVEP